MPSSNRAVSISRTRNTFQLNSLLLLILLIGSTLYEQVAASTVASSSRRNCSPIFVRWPRVRLNFSPARQAALALGSCRSACMLNEDPSKRARTQQCSAFNYQPGANEFTHECQIFAKDNVQHTDGYVEADDRYSFYWKYCVESEFSSLK